LNAVEFARNTRMPYLASSTFLFKNFWFGGMKGLAAVVALAFALTSTAAFADKDSGSSGWSGFNVGLDVGYAWDPSICTAAFPVTTNIENLIKSQVSDVAPLFAYPGLTPGQAAALAATGCVSPNVGGVIGGGQVGYNYQIGDNIVAGIEADFQGAGIQGRHGFLGAATSTFFSFLPPLPFICARFTGCPDPMTSFVDNEKTIDWLGTVRPRLGFLATPTLFVYATGGLAYGGVAAGTSIFQSWGPNPTGLTFVSPGTVGHFSGARAGWTIGGGLEWFFLPNWSVKVEYLHYDLGAVQFASGPLLTIFPAGALFISPVSPRTSDAAIPITSTRFYGDLVRAGVNYHFNF
jgi:outer membrane immunogenic protein